jgi:hypothetical protein
MVFFNTPPHPMGGDFFTTCRTFHPLDRQTIATQTLSGTHRVRPAADLGAKVSVCADRV